jgi:hypothetical protein
MSRVKELAHWFQAEIEVNGQHRKQARRKASRSSGESKTRGPTLAGALVTQFNDSIIGQVAVPKTFSMGYAI